MALNSISNLQKNRVYAPIIMGLAIIVAVFVTRPAFSSYNESKLLLSATETEISTVQAELDKIKENANKISDPNSPLAKQVTKIAKNFDSAAIIEAVMINPFTTANAVANANNSVTIKNIQLDKGSKEASGIYRGTVNITVSAQDVNAIARFLDFLSNHEQFAFALTDVNLPMNTNPAQTSALSGQKEETSVSVTLGLYYFPDNK